MQTECIYCGEEIPQGRLKALLSTKTCVNCSTAAPKKAVTVTKGTGDHTYNDIVVMEHDEYETIFKDDLRKNTLD